MTKLLLSFQSMGLEREIGAGQCSNNRASIPRPGLLYNNHISVYV
jgi:hypothetical protein